MNYKEQTFEIENNLISFRNHTFTAISIGILTSLILLGVIMYKSDLTMFLFWLTGCSLGIFSLIYFFGFSEYFQTKILLKQIAYIEVIALKTNNEKAKFKGTGQIRNFFPSGLDRKKADKLILIHQKTEKIIIGIAPENCTETISAFREKGINVIEETTDSK